MVSLGMRQDRRAWFIGGVLIGIAVIASLAGVFLSPPAGAGVALGWIATTAFAAGLITFALGFGGEGSVVARRPLGVISLIAVGVLPIVQAGAFFVIPAPSAPGFGPLGATALLLTIATLVAAVIAVVQVIRAGVVPAPWRFVPAWALGAVVAAQVLTQVVAVALASGGSAAVVESQNLLLTLSGIEGLVTFLAMTALVVVAIVLAVAPPRRGETVS